MFTVRGKYNTATVFSDQQDDTAVQQIKTFLDHPVFEKGPIAIMPDYHAGAGAVIGLTMPLGDKVIPNVIGVDIGCGVCAWQLGTGGVDYRALDAFIYKEIPSSMHVHKKSLNIDLMEKVYGKENDGLKLKRFLAKVRSTAKKISAKSDYPEYCVQSLGTLGGGNHFIEIDRSLDGSYWLVIHSGSRNFGLKTALYHQGIACKTVGKMGGLEYLQDGAALEYLEDMHLAQIFAALNRRLMGCLLIKNFFGLSYDSIPLTESVHNTIHLKDRVIRKGAISAHQGEQVVIPLNMADGIIIGKGKGNPEWNYSAPHGAGRVLSRTQAHKTLQVSVFRALMEKQGVFSTCVCEQTLDECPLVYKKAESILADIAPAVEVEQVMKPVYNFKAPE